MTKKKLKITGKKIEFDLVPWGDFGFKKIDKEFEISKPLLSPELKSVTDDEPDYKLSEDNLVTIIAG